MLCRAIFRSHIYHATTRVSYNTTRNLDYRRRRLEVFDAEKKRQLQNISVKKVCIKVFGNDGESKVLLMNDGISSYFDCMRHMSRLKAERTALVRLLNKSEDAFFSVHDRINGDSEIELLGFNNMIYYDYVNKAYWRTCAYILGAIIENSFRNQVHLIRPESLDYKSGRFAYRVEIEDLNGWKASQLVNQLVFLKDDLAVLSLCISEFISRKLPFESLRVTRQVAAIIFRDNKWKIESLEEEDEELFVFKLGNHVDICDGPLINNSSQIGKFAVTKVDYEESCLCFYGVSLPAEQKCTSYTWDLLVAASRQSEENYGI
ncbi:unnamed protein product [Dracunculus medinensis]|uniref:39S ribosomal protein L39, mitochondrial n=1 Tax=Dracunculus medinensis TaxID=318479 RepID=A0A0N4UQD3_DRAME|nr:unnamed protein product [Dracunculus medinensis]